MEETTKMLLRLTEENVRYKLAIQNLKTKMNDLIKNNRPRVLDEEEINEVLEIAGLRDVEVNAITFENAPEDTAYES